MKSPLSKKDLLSMQKFKAFRITPLLIARTVYALLSVCAYLLALGSSSSMAVQRFSKQMRTPSATGQLHGMRFHGPNLHFFSGKDKFAISFGTFSSPEVFKIQESADDFRILYKGDSTSIANIQPIYKRPISELGADPQIYRIKPESSSPEDLGVFEINPTDLSKLQTLSIGLRRQILFQFPNFALASNVSERPVFIESIVRSIPSEDPLTGGGFFALTSAGTLVQFSEELESRVVFNEQPILEISGFRYTSLENVRICLRLESEIRCILTFPFSQKIQPSKDRIYRDPPTLTSIQGGRDVLCGWSLGKVVCPVYNPHLMEQIPFARIDEFLILQNTFCAIHDQRTELTCVDTALGTISVKINSTSDLEGKRVL